MDKEIAKQIELGRELYKNGEFEKAEPILRKLAEENPSFADVMNMLGVIYYNRGQVDRAQEQFEKALRINPRYTEAALNLVVAYNDLGKYGESRKIFSMVMTFSKEPRQVIEPFARGKLANMHAQLGRVYADLGNYDEAAAQYQKALDLCPTFLDLRTQLAQIFHEAGRTDEAITELKKVKEARPDYVPATLALGITYFAKGDNTAARREWESILEKEPDHLSARMYLRMVNQILAQQEAAARGMPLEVDTSSHLPPPHPPDDDELTLMIGDDEGHRFLRESTPGGDKAKDKPESEEIEGSTAPKGKKQS